jgi:hypothetical protein
VASATSKAMGFIFRHVYDASRNANYDLSRRVFAAATAEFDPSDRGIEVEPDEAIQAQFSNLEGARNSGFKHLHLPSRTFHAVSDTVHGTREECLPPLSTSCSMNQPRLFVTATISQDCTRENCSSLLIALKERPRGLKIKSSSIEEGDRKRIRLR